MNVPRRSKDERWRTIMELFDSVAALPAHLGTDALACRRTRVRRGVGERLFH